MGRYRKYAEYKDTGVAWLGLVPTHWHIHKTKHLFVRMQRAVTPEDEIVTAFRDGQVTLRSNRRTDGFTQSIKEIGYQGVKSGDLVVHAMDGFAGAIGVSDSDGKCSPVYSVCVANRGRQLEMRYYGYLVRQLAVTEYITALARGIRERSTEFRYNEFASLDLACPPHPEQTQIAAFLDYETAKIDALIAKQQELIALLKEKRQATISHAVTKGLNPNAPMRDSGVEWLGEVPEHWQIFALKRICDVRDGTHDTPEFLDQSDDCYPLITSKDLIADQVIFEDVKYISKKDFDNISKRSGVNRGDILMPMIGSVGGAVIVETDRQFSIKNIALFKKSKYFNAQWLQYLLNSRLAILQFELEKSGGVQGFVGLGALRNLYFLFPLLNEQTIIANFLKHETTKLDTLTAEAQRAIELLKERRTALISAAVTGKIDVRGLVADKLVVE